MNSLYQRIFGDRTSQSDETPWHLVCLGAIVALTAFLTLYQLPSLEATNTYYAAAVKNMLTDPTAFFYVSFDAGFVSVDKPPLGLWIQAASAWLFGLHGWSLLLPQAIACILSVVLVYRLVSHPFDERAGLLAALTMALTPIVIPTSRNNTADMLVVLAVLAGAWLLLRAIETGRRRWLLGATFAVGLGFNIKMMQAYLVLPAFYLTYLVASRRPLRWRLTDLTLATLVLGAISLAWAVFVELTPASLRPYVGSTTDNSMFSLIIGYNGIERLTGGGRILPIGTPGPFRLFGQDLAGQIAWVLPIAIVGLVLATWQNRSPLVAAWQTRSLPRLDLRQASLVLWGTWFLTAATFFSVAGFFHPYYLVMLAPAVGALVGIGVRSLWQEYQRTDWRRWLLPATLLGTAAVQAYVLATYPSYASVLTPFIVGGSLVVSALLVLARTEWDGRHALGPHAGRILVAGLLVLLVAPAIWGGITIVQGSSGTLPAAGPATGGPGGGLDAGGAADGGGGGAPAGGTGGFLDSGGDAELLEFLLANQGDATYLLAGETHSNRLASLMLSTDAPIISLGGFSGTDPVMSADDLASLVSDGEVRFVLVENGSGVGPGGSGFGAGGPPGAGDDRSGDGLGGNAPPGDRPANDDSAFDGPDGNATAGNSPVNDGSADGGPPGDGQGSGAPSGALDQAGTSGTTEWVQENCEIVPAEEWTGDGDSGSLELYDCSSVEEGESRD